MKINLGTFGEANRKLPHWQDVDDHFGEIGAFFVEFIELEVQTIATVGPESGLPSQNSSKTIQNGSKTHTEVNTIPHTR